MTGKVRDHPWNKLNKSTRLMVEAAGEILQPDGGVHIFEYEGSRALTKDGVTEIIEETDDHKYRVVTFDKKTCTKEIRPDPISCNPLFRDGPVQLVLIHPIKKFKTFNFYTGEWDKSVRCRKCRHLFEPHSNQEIYCPNCRKEMKEWQTLQVQGKRLAEKIRKWIDLGYSTEEINLRLNGIATCARCHKPFPAKRVDAKHCNRCRTAISREKSGPPSVLG